MTGPGGVAGVAAGVSGSDPRAGVAGPDPGTGLAGTGTLAGVGGVAGSGTLVRLRPGVWTATGPDGVLHLLAPPRQRRLGPATPALRAALTRLAGEPSTVEDLGLVAELDADGWLATTATWQGRPQWTVLPLGPAPGGPDGVLSRFAALRRDGTGLVLESPRAEARVQVHDPGLLPLLAGPSPAGSPAAAGGPAARFRADLARWGFLVADPAAEEDSLAVAQWSPAELAFHAASRLGRHHPPGPAGIAGTGWAAGRWPPVPARRPPTGSTVDLRRADLDRLRETDPPLTAVLEARRTVRGGDDDRPVTAGQLGEFLDRCAGVRAEWTDGGAELSRRPYPSGGALHELTLYLAVRRVEGLDAGFYRHDPYGHRLERVTGPSPPVRRMLDLAGAAAESPPPQVLVVVAARFGRLMAKYRAIGYSLVLKHVGALTQVMYSVATAMELAPCALGTGDADAFAAATGADPLVESAVGELALGSLPTGAVPWGAGPGAVPPERR